MSNGLDLLVLGSKPEASFTRCCVSAICLNTPFSLLPNASSLSLSPVTSVVLDPQNRLGSDYSNTAGWIIDLTLLGASGNQIGVLL
jgi:hypothetical protein